MSRSTITAPSSSIHNRASLFLDERVLANSWDYCDGRAKDLAWFQNGYKTTVEPGDIVTYRQYVADVVSRYADNPTIAMWQLVNEGQALNDDGTCNESAGLSALLGFSDDVGGLVHSIDPNHLVSLGVIPGYAGGLLQFCGAANGDYETLMASPGNDVCDFHDYGYPTEPMGIPTVPDLKTAIAACHADGKPLMVAETGIFATSDAQLPTRAAQFQAKLLVPFTLEVPFSRGILLLRHSQFPLSEGPFRGYALIRSRDRVNDRG